MSKFKINITPAQSRILSEVEAYIELCDLDINLAGGKTHTNECIYIGGDNSDASIIYQLDVRTGAYVYVSNSCDIEDLPLRIESTKQLTDIVKYCAPQINC